MRCRISVLVLIELFGWPTTAILIPNVSAPDLSTSPCTWEEVHAKKLTLVLYGVTGFTGRLAAKYFTTEHPEIQHWAIAGREKKKVDYIKSTLVGNNMSNLESIAVGLKNEAGLLGMAKRTRAIISFAGPYEKIGGEALIRAALEGCAHYVDISTETHWKAAMLKKYAATAEARGVALVQSAGFASLASDFLAMLAIQDVVKVQQLPPSYVKVLWTTHNTGFSGGQLATNQYESMHHGPLTDPYILTPDTAVEKRVDVTIDGMESYGVHDVVGKLSKSAFASFDCPVIRRSVKMKFPDDAISVQQAAKASMFNEQMAFLSNKTLNQWEGAVPKNPTPGQGPPHWVQARGSFAAMAIAGGRWTTTASYSGEEGIKYSRITLEGHGDPSFMGSAIMATELALGLASNGPDWNPDGKKGGYLTPSLALGTEALEHRLKAVRGGYFVTITHR